MTPVWVTAFLDLPAERYDAGVAFWSAVTGFGPSAPRGDRAELATLVPEQGDPYLRVQRVAEGAGGIHLDVHRPDRDFRVRRSPAGLAWCEVSESLSGRPPPATWPGGHRSQVDQVCLDIPPSAYEQECEFWRSLTGWDLVETGSPEFLRLLSPPDQPLQLLLQRLDREQPPGAHLDLAADDGAAEIARHVALGASEVGPGDGWTVLRDPTGVPYCVTERSPAPDPPVEPGETPTSRRG